MLAESSSFGFAEELPPPRDTDDMDGVAASLVKRSEMALSCIRGGSWMCTSGSRTLGCMMVSTVSGWSTRTGMSWVMTFSRSRFIDSSRGSWLKSGSPKGSSSLLP